MAAVGRGDVETAGDLTKHALADPVAQLSAARRGYILRTQMHTAGIRADTGFALRLAHTASDCFATAHMRLETSRTLVDVTQICLDAGDITEVNGLLDDAHDLALHCGSQRLLDQIGHLRRRLDDLTADTDTDADTHLTDRELQVARLARIGMRSKDIAGQLFVSVRTVDTHLSRIYRKLGISTRTELARTNIGVDDNPADQRSTRISHRLSSGADWRKDEASERLESRMPAFSDRSPGRRANNR
ncbi:helix-turn-helix transcriptional regulator [Catellatospora citrea]|uniref:helix-turn-helix transcriptional regulator n=1 Tax=Catellatospora citrea TaxID=53366 RepID=UPI00340A735F